jgi:rubrerythrin
LLIAGKEGTMTYQAKNYDGIPEKEAPGTCPVCGAKGAVFKKVY